MYKSEYDVIVIGAGPGGIPAAIAAARRGMNVLLVERNACLGGLLVSGLPMLAFLDRSGNQVIGGIAQEIVDRLIETGGGNKHIVSPVLNSMTHVNPAWMRIVLSEMCTECESMDILLYSELARVYTDNGCVRGVDIFCRGNMMHFESGVVIDATGDACVVYMSGAAYEKSENLQPMSLTFDLTGVDYDRVFDFLEAHPEERTLPDTFPGIKNSMEFLRNNKCSSFMGFMHMVEEGRKKGTFTLDRNMIDFCRQINGVAFINTARIVNADSTDMESIIGAEFESLRQIKELVTFMKKNIPGFEHAELTQIAPYIGVRESRRVVGVKQLKEADVDALNIPEDTIAMAGYNRDTHSPVDGKMYMLPTKHGIGVPYGCLVPKTMDGLLVSGRAISVTHEVFAMTRIMPTCMAVGEACGAAAAMAVRNSIQPRDVDVSALREDLLKAGAILDIPH